MMIFLIGYMGAGKSAVSRTLAALINFEHVDLDKHIEEKTGFTIDEIFKIYGEQWFRDKETEELHDLLGETPRLIACGGGTPCFNDNLNFMKRAGVTVYLKLPPEELVKRIKASNDIRPLVANLKGKKLLNFVKNHLAERETFYNQADIIAENENLLAENILNLIIGKLKAEKKSL